MILLSKATLEGMVAHCLGADPLEACGLLVGLPGEDGRALVRSFFPAENSSASARVYEVEPRALLVADRQAMQAGEQLIGVYHSHTHTEGRPSPTDIRQAPDPRWHYVLVTLRDIHPSVRSWQIVDGKITEEQVVLQW
ncbi:MAG TPA: M67 family metallopeptidase [Acidimicrobiales bacterium]|nr:M67 family metallopeptidase [Acidimicrobiales bacterium]